MLLDQGERNVASIFLGAIVTYVRVELRVQQSTLQKRYKSSRWHLQGLYLYLVYATLACKCKRSMIVTRLLQVSIDQIIYVVRRYLRHFLFFFFSDFFDRLFAMKIFRKVVFENRKKKKSRAGLSWSGILFACILSQAR
jgi:hypothetical protein